MAELVCVAPRRTLPFTGQASRTLLLPIVTSPAATPPLPTRCLQGLLDEVQASLLRQAREFRDANIVDVSSYEELQAAVAEGALRGKGCCGGWQPAEGFAGWWRELLGWAVDNCAGSKQSCHPI